MRRLAHVFLIVIVLAFPTGCRKPESKMEDKMKTAEDHLLTLLEELEAIGESHPEVYRMREELHAVVYLSFIEQNPQFRYPKAIGMQTDVADRRVLDALKRYVSEVIPIAESQSMGPEQRRQMFENLEIETDLGNSTDEFFGYSGAYIEGLFDDQLTAWNEEWELE